MPEFIEAQKNGRLKSEKWRNSVINSLATYNKSEEGRERTRRQHINGLGKLAAEGRKKSEKYQNFLMEKFRYLGLGKIPWNKGLTKDTDNRIRNQYSNHKVISVDFIGYQDVYDLTVDRHHNFALSAGVFVHNCRYCTRRRMVGKKEKALTWADFANAVAYIKEHEEIRDVLISGGDPLLLENERLEKILKALYAIQHVEILRIGTKAPIVMPQRITSSLCRMLQRYHPLFISINIVHPKEITPEVKLACDKLTRAGIPLGSQTVLLKGVNDTPEIMKKLMHEILKIRVRPYYIYQCDLVKGLEHFRTPIDTGIEIMDKLRGWTTGYAVPTYVVDAAGGGGKIPVGPDYVVSRTKKKLVLRNYKGKEFEYQEMEAL
jgi:KamA family protein